MRADRLPVVSVLLHRLSDLESPSEAGDRQVAWQGEGPALEGAVARWPLLTMRGKLSVRLSPTVGRERGRGAPEPSPQKGRGNRMKKFLIVSGLAATALVIWRLPEERRVNLAHVAQTVMEA